MRLPRKAKRPATARRPRTSEAVRRAREVLAIERGALHALAERLDRSFEQAIAVLGACEGKIIVTGMGKSGIICRKIAATFASTGSPAVFLHAAEAAHGDAGVFVKGDVVLALSHSGETEEVLRLLPMIKRLGLPLVAMTGGQRSTLARAADVALDVSVAEEACPMGLAPTASTTTALALGDALAVVLLERKGFGPQDFAVLHPAGALGRRFLKVADLMHSGEDIPAVAPSASFQVTLYEMTRKRLGITGVVNEREELVGVVTDGDVRRAVERIDHIRVATASEIMTRSPKTISAVVLAEQALAEMQKHSITALFVLAEGSKRPIGVIHLHDLLKAGVV